MTWRVGPRVLHVKSRVKSSRRVRLPMERRPQRAEARNSQTAIQTVRFLLPLHPPVAGCLVHWMDLEDSSDLDLSFLWRSNLFFC